MRTEELVTLLASDAGAVPRHVAARRYALALAVGLAGAAVLMATLLGMRADLATVATLPKFWIKVGFVAGVVGTSLFAAFRLSRPGARFESALGSIALPVAIIWIVAAFALLEARPQDRAQMLLGQTWSSCPLLIAALSVPAFAAMTWAVKGLAPTRLRLAGFAAGLLAGAVATLVYSLHCPEMEAPFVALWYLLGMLIPAGVGAWLGPALLRW
jgi:hypothetical protein